jgi:myo-inositol-1(or 4)-monophosphatase
MSSPTLADLERLARQAGRILSTGYEKDHQVDYKGTIDLVTEIDHASEKFLLEEIHRQFPGHDFLAEESGASGRETEHLWIIDPLDGTVNYAHGVPLFCVSIAYAYRGEVKLGAVYEPLRDELYSAERGQGARLNGRPLQVSKTSELIQSLLVTGFAYDIGQNPLDNLDNFVKFSKVSRGVRRLGSAAIDLCYVAAGRLDGYWELSIKPWDIAAGGLIAEEAGARVTKANGEALYLRPPQSVLAANPVLHRKILENLTGNAPLA